MMKSCITVLLKKVCNVEKHSASHPKFHPGIIFNSIS